MQKLHRAHGCAEGPSNWRMVQYNLAEDENQPANLVWFFEHNSTGFQIQCPTPAVNIRYCIWCGKDLIPPEAEKTDADL